MLEQFYNSKHTEKMKTVIHRILVIIAFLMSCAFYDKVCAANSGDEGYNTILTFYTKYINLRLNNHVVLSRTFTEGTIKDCENKKYNLLQEYCIPQLVNRQKKEDKYGMGFDLITDENDIDSISLSTLSVTSHSSYYTVSFQVHEFTFCNSSSIVQKRFNVWVENGGKLIAKILGDNLNGEDSYSARELPPDNPVNITQNVLTDNSSWSFVDSKDSQWQSAILSFTSTTMSISAHDTETQSFLYYISKTEPKNFDKSLVGNSTEGCYIVFLDPNYESFYYFTVSEYDSEKGRLSLYNNGMDILDGSWFLLFNRK